MNIMITCLNNVFEHGMSAIVILSPTIKSCINFFSKEGVNDVTFFWYHVTLNKSKSGFLSLNGKLTWSTKKFYENTLPIQDNVHN